MFLYDDNHVLVYIGTAQGIKDHLFPKRTRTGKAVYCHNNSTMYESIKDAAIALNVDKSQLGKHLRRETSYKEVKGLVFTFKEELPCK